MIDKTKKKPVFEFFEIELLVVFREQLPEEEPVGEISLEVDDFFGELDLVVQPAVQQIAHVSLKLLFLFFKNEIMRVFEEIWFI